MAGSERWRPEGTGCGGPALAWRHQWP